MPTPLSDLLLVHGERPNLRATPAGLAAPLPPVPLPPPDSWQSVLSLSLSLFAGPCCSLDAHLSELAGPVHAEVRLGASDAVRPQVLRRGGPQIFPLGKRAGSVPTAREGTLGPGGKVARGPPQGEALLIWFPDVTRGRAQGPGRGPLGHTSRLPARDADSKEPARICSQGWK